MPDPTIAFTFPDDGVTQCYIHLEHHAGLIQELLEAYAVRVGPPVCSDPAELIEMQVIRELNDPYSDWAAEELLRLGYISTYHQWERQVRRLLAGQLESRGSQFPRLSGRPFPVAVRACLEAHFASTIDSQIWTELNAARSMVNSLKHDLELETPDNEMIVGAEQFHRLLSTLRRFWDALPYRVDYPSSKIVRSPPFSTR